MLDLAGFLAIFENLGYLGIFVIGFIGSIIVFVPIPYFPVLVAAALNKNLDPNLISLSSALGAILAKSIIFYADYYGRNALSKQTKKRIYPLQKLVARYGSLGAFIAALTPIPDVFGVHSTWTCKIFSLEVYSIYVPGQINIE